MNTKYTDGPSGNVSDLRSLLLIVVKESLANEFLGYSSKLFFGSSCHSFCVLLIFAVVNKGIYSFLSDPSLSCAIRLPFFLFSLLKYQLSKQCKMRNTKI